MQSFEANQNNSPLEHSNAITCIKEERPESDKIESGINSNNIEHNLCHAFIRDRIKLIHNYCKLPDELQNPISTIPPDNLSGNGNVVPLKNDNSSQIKFLIENFSEPLVFKSILSWEMINWSLQDWENELQKETLPCRCGKNLHSKYPQWETTTLKKTFAFKNFIEMSESNSEDWIYFDYKYLKDWFLNNEKIKKDISWKMFGYPEIGSQASTIWIGTKGAHTPCHIDTYGFNLVAQVLGRKLWLLFPPTEDLHSTRIPYEESTIFSQVNFFSPTLQHTKGIRNCRRVVLNPGDVLFVPQGWWHYVENLELAISVNTWLPTPHDEEKRLEEAVVKMIVFQFANGLSEEEKKFVLIQDNDDNAPNQHQLKYNLNVTHFCRKSYQNFLELNEKSRENVNRSVDSKKIIGDILENLSNFISPIPVLDDGDFLTLLIAQRNKFGKKWLFCNDDDDSDDESGEVVISKTLNAILKSNVINVIKNNLLNP